MSIQSEITRITNKRDLSFNAVEAKGVTVPSNSTINDLPNLIASISTGVEAAFFQFEGTSSGSSYTLSKTESFSDIASAYNDGKIIYVTLEITSDNVITEKLTTCSLDVTDFELGDSSCNIMFFGPGTIFYLSYSNNSRGSWSLSSNNINLVTSVNGQTGAVSLAIPSVPSDIGAGTYSKPSGGIPKTDLAVAVQSSLDRADSALQVVDAQDVINLDQYIEGYGYYIKPQGGIPASDIANGVIPSVASDVGAIAVPNSASTNDVLTYINGAWGAASAPSNIFWATYSSSISSQIDTAYQAGKYCVVKMDTGVDLPLLWRYSSTYHVFSMAYNHYVYTAICNNGTWSKTTVDLAMASTVPSTASDIGAIAAPASASINDFLCWNGSAWAATAVPQASGVSF